MRMRSPSSAPPVRRRVGSTAITAMRIVGKRARNRSSSSSATLDLPAPPVPVMPMTGVAVRRRGHVPAQLRQLGLVREHSRSIAESDAADRDLVVEIQGAIGAARCGRVQLGALAGSARRGAIDIVDHADQADVHAVVGVVDALDAVGLELRRSPPA